jgi:hypothetical protein
VATVPFEEAWANSPHNDITSESFIHWDGDDPAVVPASCAKCHSEPGYLDFLGADAPQLEQSTPKVSLSAPPSPARPAITT